MRQVVFLMHQSKQREANVLDAPHYYQTEKYWRLAIGDWRSTGATLKGRQSFARMTVSILSSSLHLLLGSLPFPEVLSLAPIL